jgi:hypothetical protein
MNAFETALSAFGSKVVPFISTNFLLVVAASLATVVSIVALVFVIRRNIGPSSGTLSPDKVSADDVDRETSEIVRLLIKKIFSRSWCPATWSNRLADRDSPLESLSSLPCLRW